MTNWMRMSSQIGGVVNLGDGLDTLVYTVDSIDKFTHLGT